MVVILAAIMVVMMMVKVLNLELEEMCQPK